MTTGLAVGFADALLQAIGGTAIATDAQRVVAAEPHSDDPGASGTANSVLSSFSGRFPNITWGSPATNGDVREVAMNNGTLPEITCTTPATVTSLSLWSANTAGTFRGSCSIASRTLAINDILRLNTLKFSLKPIAA
jgi:hypothetical protein